jgi:single-strand DNA-binding protein
MDINRVIIIANTTKDVDLKQTPSGASVANFSIASNRKFKSGDETKEEVSFFDCVVWGKLAELCNQYVNKGDRVGIEGRLQQRRWENTEGKTQSKVEIVVENIQFLSNKKDGQKSTGQGVVSSGLSDNDNPFSEESIPF